MDNEQIKSTVEHFKEEGGIRVRDIAFTLLSRMFTDGKTAYQCLFGQDGYDEYMSDEMRSKLEDYLTEQGYIRNLVIDDENGGGLTFEENKAAMEQMLVDIQRDMKAGIIEPKDAYARMSDIRTKLNDKFKVESKKQDRLIIVEKKFDFVCPFTRHECYQLDKEDAMKKWNLIENTNNDGDNQ